MIQPGLERISQLLKNVQFPWKSIHVAGTNGKGSICHYASNLITRRKLKCGKFTSPHLVDRWDCITINNQPVDETLFRKIEKHYIELNLIAGIRASPFEILTATAFHIFNEERVHIGVVEVGMGGQQDATNILNNQAVSVISKIARDHQNFLGNTLEDIALHKAGILRPNVPYIINPNNEEYVKDVIDQHAKSIGAGPRLLHDSAELKQKLFNKSYWKLFVQPLRPFQEDNATLAVIAAKQAVESLDLDFRHFDLGNFLLNTRLHVNPGRLQRIRVPAVFGSYENPKGQEILVDGAHNPDAAKVLIDCVNKVHRRGYIEGLGRHPRVGWPVTWVLAMTEGKDASEYLRVLLRPGDHVITTTFGPVDGMPSVKPMDPEQLLQVAKSVQEGITGLAMPKDGAFRALLAAKHLTKNGWPVVLTGSLYLVGDFHREARARSSANYWYDPELEEDRKKIKVISREEQARVNRLLSSGHTDPLDQPSRNDEQRIAEREKGTSSREKRRVLQMQMENLDRELERIVAEEQQIRSDWVDPTKQNKEEDSQQLFEPTRGDEMKPKTIERPEEGGKLDEGKKLEESERPEESANSEQTGEAPKIRLFFQDDRKTRNHPVVQRERRHGKSPEVRILVGTRPRQKLEKKETSS
ncbi:FolC bifunctional protein [Stemphylium lycopersici]|nr:FolC bifunctional protein [Stemphylium lycopersici]